ncbi:ninjurin-1-like isoform X2 [Euwallacea fornicatus]|uniref:ninjurin-1-like isoform X2 n=1 Tax=Euwallacea fornicatus TaxID=995702 RepID=UPI00338D5DEA
MDTDDQGLDLSNPQGFLTDHNNNEQPNVDQSTTPDGAKKNLEDEEAIPIIESEDGGSSDNTRRISLYEIAGKKTAAQGLMDIALITANANQMRYLLEFNRGSHTYHITLTLIIASLTLQVAVAMFLIFKGRYYVKGQSKSARAKLIKNCVLFGVFLITVVNIFIASFTTMDRT